MYNLILIRTEQLKPSPDNPFEPLPDEDYQDLRDSVRESGFFHPLIVREAGDGVFEVLDGNQRLRVARERGIDALSCIVVDSDPVAGLNAVYDVNLDRRHLTKQQINKYLMQKKEQREEKIRQHLFSKLIPEVIDKVNEQIVSMEMALKMANTYTEAEQKAWVQACEVEIEGQFRQPDDYENDGRLEELQQEMEKLRADNRTEILRLRNQIESKEKELKEARQRESRQKELIEGKKDVLENAMEKAGELLRKEYEKDLEDFRLRLVDMSKAVEEKQVEIEALKARRHSLDEKEKTYQTEINAQKVLISDIRDQHNKEIEKLSYEIKRYWQPELIVHKLEHVAEMIRSTNSYIVGQNYPAETFVDFQKMMARVTEAYTDLAKTLDDHN